MRKGGFTVTDSKLGDTMVEVGFLDRGGNGLDSINLLNTYRNTPEEKAKRIEEVKQELKERAIKHGYDIEF